MTDYMICQNQDNHLLYALKHGRFWFWDKHQTKWVPSDWAAQQYAKAQTKEPDLTQEDWLGHCFGTLMDDYEVPDAVVKALRALSNKEEPPCKVNTTAPNADAAVTMAAPAATLAEETSTTPVDANSCPPVPCSPADASGATPSPSGAAAACSAAEFDYSGLDAQTVTDLHLAEQIYTSGRKLAEMGLRRMADGVSLAHDALCGTVVTMWTTGSSPPKRIHSAAGAKAWAWGSLPLISCFKSLPCLIPAAPASSRFWKNFPLPYYMPLPNPAPPPLWCRRSRMATSPPTSSIRTC